MWLLARLRALYGAGFDDLVLVLVAGALLLTGTAVLIRALFLRHLIARERDTLTLEPKHKRAAVAMGAVIGLVLAVTSAGSGTLIAVGLIMIYRLSPRRVVGTDVFHAAILLWVASAGHLIAGNIDFGLAANILVGSVPGVWLGAGWRCACRSPACGRCSASSCSPRGSGCSARPAPRSPPPPWSASRLRWAGFCTW